jgi:hypothetical protein
MHAQCPMPNAQELRNAIVDITAEALDFFCVVGIIVE